MTTGVSNICEAMDCSQELREFHSGTVMMPYVHYQTEGEKRHAESNKSGKLSNMLPFIMVE